MMMKKQQQPQKPARHEGPPLQNVGGQLKVRAAYLHPILWRLELRFRNCASRFRLGLCVHIMQICGCNSVHIVCKKGVAGHFSAGLWPDPLLGLRHGVLPYIRSNLSACSLSTNYKHTKRHCAQLHVRQHQKHASTATLTWSSPTPHAWSRTYQKRYRQRVYDRASLSVGTRAATLNPVPPEEEANWYRPYQFFFKYPRGHRSQLLACGAGRGLNKHPQTCSAQQ
jgi:hypothetical protein